MRKLKEAKRGILDSRSIAIVCHRNADGDCLGSLLALGLGLSTLKKRVLMVSPDGVPSRYQKLPGTSKVKRRIEKVPDMAIAVDCNAKEMLGRPFNVIRKAKYILEIDHHEYRKPFGNLFLVDSKAAAVGELVYQLLKYLNIDITKDIAQNILTSIIVETNSFRLPKVRPFTFRLCDRLLRTGLDYHKLSETVYWSKRKQVAILSGICMSKIKFLKNSKIAWSIISRKEFAEVKGKDEDVDAVADDILAIKTVKIAILFREKSPGFLRVSLRSKGGINVAFLAYKYGGGGHFDSAGCYIPNKKEAITELMREAEEELK